MLDYAYVQPHPLFPLTLGATQTGLAWLQFGHARPPAASDSLENGSNPLIQQALRELEEYFRGTRQSFEVPLDLHGTAFQMRVWAALLAIPYGETRTYIDVAAAVGSPHGARAVGGANHANPVAIIVPCHRVVNAGGGLGGYGGGLDRKRFLLNLEAGRQSAYTPGHEGLFEADLNHMPESEEFPPRTGHAV